MDPTAASREVKHNRAMLNEVVKSRFRAIHCQKFETREARGPATRSTRSAVATATIIIFGS